MKAICCFLLSVCLAQLSVGQDTFKGTYQYTDPAGMSGVTLEFSGNKFRKVLTTDTNEKIGEGYYVVNADKLMLFFLAIKNPDSSTYVVCKEKRSAEDPTILFNIHVEDGYNKEPYQGVLVGIKKFNGEVPFSFLTNASGDARFFLYHPQEFKLLTIIPIGGYDPVEIPLQDLTGNTVEVKCVLQPQHTVVYDEDREDYQIRGRSKNKLILYSKESGEMVFTKE